MNFSQIKNGVINISRSVIHTNRRYVSRIRNKNEVWKKTIIEPKSLICTTKTISTSGSLFSKYKHNRVDNDDLPQIIHFRNPVTWLVVRFRLLMLKKAWDPEFSLEKFATGSKQAVCNVCQLISEHKMDELCGLLTVEAREKLVEDLRHPIIYKSIPHMYLTPANLQVAAPDNVQYLIRDNRRFCAVDMIFVFLKWVSANKSDGVFYLETFARFRREYTDLTIPEWTIIQMKFLKCDIVDYAK